MTDAEDFARWDADGGKDPTPPPLEVPRHPVKEGRRAGYGVRGDDRKRLARNDFLRELVAAAWDEGWRDAGYHQDVNPYRESP